MLVMAQQVELAPGQPWLIRERFVSKASVMHRCGDATAKTRISTRFGPGRFWRDADIVQLRGCQFQEAAPRLALFEIATKPVVTLPASGRVFEAAQ
ncbi:hypothetical protein ACVJBD_005540 [Rhizobium mongolense]